MRKLILAPMALACLIGTAIAQQAPTSTADQGRPGAAPWPVSWTGQSVLADLRVAGSPVAAGNPVPISGSITANIGTTNGLALDASVQQVKTALGSPFQAGGNIGNTAFGISGTLPPFASTPTVNLGSLNGAATASAQGTGNTSLASIDGKLGALGQKASAGSAPVVIASDQPSVATKIDQTTPCTTNGVVVNSSALPAGAATAALQNSVVAQLTSANQRTTYFSEANNLSTAVNASAGGATARDTGVSPSSYTKLNAYFYSTQAGVATILGSDDGQNFYAVYSQQMAAGTPYTPSGMPITFRYYFFKVTNGNVATANITAKGSFSTN